MDTVTLSALREKAPTPRELYLSQLTLDLRRREVWRLLGDTYDMHQRLLMAFPEAHEGGAGRMLFRVDSGKGEAKILVQSDINPDWSRLPEGMTDNVLGPKAWQIIRADGNFVFAAGQKLRYRLRANPTFRHSQRNVENPKKNAPRLAHLTPITQAEWLVRKGEEHGFTIPLVPSGTDWLDPFADELEEERRETPYDVRITPLDQLKGNKPASAEGSTPHRLTHYGVDFDGVLTVTDPAALAAAVAGGIGPAKGFGFGLLSLARS